MGPLEKYLCRLIDDSDGDVVQVQLLFKPGVSSMAGAVRRHATIDGLYEFATPTQAQADMPGPDGRVIKEGELVVISIAFEGDSLLQISRPIESKSIIAPPMVGHA